ncbi:hypothetical protein CVT24_012405 [Panaeolus cyanescens]|uniref:F-box domain-containing protein n=1 Tax=Panaeolus cyanescens TaxID=181874 RepID=A0A409YJ99_9AGAR|nr:hypothetical protein CVT24_012405 [Panaeolus cyanescens]
MLLNLPNPSAQLSPAMNQPKDTLQMIFQELFPPLSLPITPPLYLDRYASPHFPGRILSVITLCRSWYLAGLSTLYRGIQIVALKQLLTLLDILDKPDSHYRFWVQSIEFHVTFPDDSESFTSLFAAPFKRMSQICPNIRSLSFNAEDDILRTFPWQFGNIHLLQTCYSLTHLHISNVGSFSGLVKALRHVSARIASLSITTYGPDIPVGDDHEPAINGSPLILSCLHTLSITPSGNLMESVLKWELPLLERLVLSKTRWFEVDYRTCKAFFEKFCQRLKTLELHPDNFYAQEFGSVPWLWYGKILRRVPALEHLVVHHYGSWHFPYKSYSHPNIKWIDIREEQ